jgi:hypothetical protein
MVLVAFAVVLLIPARALAQTGATVTLDASERTIEFGQKVTLSGTSTGAPAGSTVQILDQASTEVAAATTDGSGAFAVRIEPQSTNSYVAVLADATSDPVTVAVRAALSVRMAPVRLFDRVQVRGTVKPARFIPVIASTRSTWRCQRTARSVPRSRSDRRDRSERSRRSRRRIS